jgi:hypothetical protein
MSQVFVPAYLVALGPFVPFVLIAVLGALISLALWLLGKGGWRAWLGWAIVAGIAAQVAGAWL